MEKKEMMKKKKKEKGKENENDENENEKETMHDSVTTVFMFVARPKFTKMRGNEWNLEQITQPVASRTDTEPGGGDDGEDRKNRTSLGKRIMDGLRLREKEMGAGDCHGKRRGADIFMYRIFIVRNIPWKMPHHCSWLLNTPLTH